MHQNISVERERDLEFHAPSINVTILANNLYVQVLKSILVNGKYRVSHSGRSHWKRRIKTKETITKGKKIMIFQLT